MKTLIQLTECFSIVKDDKQLYLIGDDGTDSWVAQQINIDTINNIIEKLKLLQENYKISKD